ncbi:hypothetical protein AB0926_04930, partial [Streptomyces griseoincarnatus]
AADMAFALKGLSVADAGITGLASTIGIADDTLHAFASLDLPTPNPLGDSLASMEFTKGFGGGLVDWAPAADMAFALKGLSVADAGITGLASTIGIADDTLHAFGSLDLPALNPLGDSLASVWNSFAPIDLKLPKANPIGDAFASVGFARSVADLVDWAPAADKISIALKDLSLAGAGITSLATAGIADDTLHAFGSLDLPALNPLGDSLASVWSHVFDMPGLAGLLRGLPDDLLTPMRSVARRIERLGAPIVWAARAALDAYLDGDHDPMHEFLYTHLRLRPPTEDHAQALAMALFLREWEKEVDLQDADAVRAILRKHAREGNDLDGDHQVMGRMIGHLPEELELLSPAPGPEVLAIARVVPWSEHFDNRYVRYATRRLKETEQRVARVWAENPEINWLQAPELVDQDIAMGTRVRRKLLRAGDQIIERAAAQLRRTI